MRCTKIILFRKWSQNFGNGRKHVDIHSAHGKAHADNGTHEGRDEHGADDDGGGVDIQTQRGDEDGENEHPEVAAAEGDARVDPVDDGLFVFLVGPQIQIAANMQKKALEVHTCCRLQRKRQEVQFIVHRFEGSRGHERQPKATVGDAF